MFEKVKNYFGVQTIEVVFEPTICEQVRDAQIPITKSQALRMVKEVSQSPRTMDEKLDAYDIIDTMAVNGLEFGEYEEVKLELMVADSLALANEGILDAEAVAAWERDERAWFEKYRR